jgi:chromosome segregation ATPase
LDSLVIRAQSSSTAPTCPTTRSAQVDLLKKTIQEKDTRIEELEVDLKAAHTRADALCAELSGKAAELTCLQLNAIQNENQLSQTNLELQKTQIFLAGIQEHLQKARKRTRRLEREKETIRSTYQSRLQETTGTHKKVSGDLSRFVAEAEANVESLSGDLDKARRDLSAEKEINATLRKKVRSLDMQRRRAKGSLRDVRRRLDKLRTWKGTSKGTYRPEARRLARALLHAGCAGDRVGEAIVACAKAFRIDVLRVPSRRTVFRARDEGGHFGLMQLGREIAQSKGESLVP